VGAGQDDGTREELQAHGAAEFVLHRLHGRRLLAPFAL
jgi:hypothetical protein